MSRLYFSRNLTTVRSKVGAPASRYGAVGDALTAASGGSAQALPILSNRQAMAMVFLSMV
ncbi:hypothetical protein D3C75_1385890 [compost metagenome]